MIMKIDDSHQGDSISTTDRQKTAPKECKIAQQTKEDEDDENDDSSDSDTITCPLFMDGLPKNFSTNPQLAAIASLLNDDNVNDNDNDNDDDDDDAKDDEERDHDNKCNKNTLTPSHQNNTLGSNPLTKTGKFASRTRNRRRQRHASPYPRQPSEANNKQPKKGASVGEITLFMNMWKP